MARHRDRSWLCCQRLGELLETLHAANSARIGPSGDSAAKPRSNHRCVRGSQRDLLQLFAAPVLGQLCASTDQLHAFMDAQSRPVTPCWADCDLAASPQV